MRTFKNGISAVEIKTNFQLKIGMISVKKWDEFSSKSIQKDTFS
jgi:hypothetical protein